MRRSELPIERDGAGEVLQGFVAAIQNGEEKTDLVLDAGGLGIERRGLLPGSKRAGGIAAGLEIAGAGFQLRECGLGEGGARQERRRNRKGPDDHLNSLTAIRAATYASGSADRGW